MSTPSFTIFSFNVLLSSNELKLIKSILKGIYNSSILKKILVFMVFVTEFPYNTMSMSEPDL